MESQPLKTIVRADAMLVGNNLDRISPAAIFIEDGRITALGSAAEARAKEAGKEIILDGQTLLPGLIDCHNHMSLDPTQENYLLRMTDGTPELTIRAVKSLQNDLMSGVTTARYMGDKAFIDTACRDAIRRGAITGPYPVIATRGIRATHGHGFVGYPFNGVEAIRTAVRDNMAAGADFIKVYLTGTLMSDRGIPCFFSEEEVNVLVTEAHRCGLPVATHCIGGSALDLAIDVGIDFIEHAYFITDEQIEKIRYSDSRLVLTPSMFFYAPRLKTLPPSLVAGHLEQRDLVRKRMEAVVKAGLAYGAGTDGNHGLLSFELQCLVAFGETPRNAIKSATTIAAAICGKAGETGCLAEDRQADIIGVKGNPLENIDRLAEVTTVIQGGKHVK